MLSRARHVFVAQYGNNLVNGFKRFFDTGKLEIITCCATHGFLPLMPNRKAAFVTMIALNVASAAVVMNNLHNAHQLSQR